jgi:long-chain acyl-CoA synthetase
VPYLGDFATTMPGKAAVIRAETGEQVSYAELNDRSIRLANLLGSLGLGVGDAFAVLAENHVRFFELYWAARRSGRYLVPVSTRLAAEEIAYQVSDSQAKVFIVTLAMAERAGQVRDLIDPAIPCLMIDGVADGFARYEEAIAGASARQPDDQPCGDAMLYSSGTTGRPKGIRRPLRDMRADDPAAGLGLLMLTPGADESLVYLNPAPMYHAAAVLVATGVHSLGGTAIISQKFDPDQFLATVERYRVTHAQVVPTMMIRILKLPAARRQAHDLSSLSVLLHAAAPCPPEVKAEFIEWLGPVVYEYYSGTEGSGVTFISPAEWLAHPGSVGKAVIGVPHICDERGGEVPAGEPGTVYFEQPSAPFSYHGDERKTHDSRHPEHGNWTTIGDVGYLDGDGYLYLTDRRSFMIISGGVNIYPAEIENCLVLHEKVADVADFGLPDPEMGELVQAVVQPAPGVAPDEALAQELRAYVREHLAGYKVPRRVGFRDELPRMETGKLAKYLLRREYLAAAGDVSS